MDNKPYCGISKSLKMNTNSQNKYSVSVIMPALNEENNISYAINSTLEAFKEHSINGEIVVVNDGSTDNTKNIIESLKEKNSNICSIDHVKPCGIGYSFFDGVKNAQGDVVVMFPGDGENSARDALRFLPLSREVDIIVPFIHNVEVRNLFRRIVSSTYRFIVNLSFGINLNYTNGTVFYRRSILKDVKLRSLGFFYQAELLIKLIRKGYLYAEVPNLMDKRTSGKSKAISIKSLLDVIVSYIRTAYFIHFKRVENCRNYRILNAASVSHKKYVQTQQE